MINSYIKRNRWILLFTLKCAYLFTCCFFLPFVCPSPLFMRRVISFSLFGLTSARCVSEKEINIATEIKKNTQTAHRLRIIECIFFSYFAFDRASQTHIIYERGALKMRPISTYTQLRITIAIIHIYRFFARRNHSFSDCGSEVEAFVVVFFFSFCFIGN